ncbi:MAG: glycosyltransferase, partial [Myxococcota bacterium]
MVVPFEDDEEVIGKAVRTLAQCLREQALAFEIIAVDDGSGDNSMSVLALLRRLIPELKVLATRVKGRGYSVGAEQSQGKVLWFCEPQGAAHAVLAFERG